MAKKKKAKFKKLINSSIILCIGTLASLLLKSWSEEPHQPKSVPIIQRKDYTLSYDGRTKNAAWVYERITEESLKGNAKRKNIFKEDPLIPKTLRATKEDYKGSGFDRGHLFPAADAKGSKEAMDKSFYLSNISPQTPEFNRGYWAQLEKHVRELTKTYKVLHVYNGPLYLPKEESNGEKYVRYQVIGDNDVAVPTHFFKVIYAEKEDGSTDTYAYILPNDTIDKDTPLENFEVTVSKIEKVAGVIFNPAE